MVDLIPGTTLPIHTGPGGQQPEGRGQVNTIPDRMPVSLFEKLAGRDDLTPGELAFVAMAVRAIDDKPRKVKTIYDSSGGQCDATTGNLVLPLFICPTGCEGHVTSVTVDTPSSTTITPSAPFSDASAFMYLAVTGRATGDNAAANADSYRAGLVAFGPSTAAGPFLPGQWTFQSAQAPVLFGGSQLSLIIHGGSVAALAALTIRARYRIELLGVES